MRRILLLIGGLLGLVSGIWLLHAQTPPTIMLVLEVHPEQPYTATNDAKRLPAFASLLTMSLPLITQDTQVGFTTACLNPLALAPQADLSTLLKSVENLQTCAEYDVAGAFEWISRLTPAPKAVIWIANGDFELANSANPSNTSRLNAALEHLQAQKICLFVLPLGNAAIRAANLAGYVDQSQARNLTARAGCGQAFPPLLHRGLAQPFLEAYQSALGGFVLNRGQNQVFANPPSQFSLVADIPVNSAWVRWDAMWDGGLLDLRLQRPDGTQQELDTPRVNLRQGEGYLSVWLERPESGTWQLELDGNPLESGQRTVTSVVSRFSSSTAIAAETAILNTAPTEVVSPVAALDEVNTPQQSLVVVALVVVGGVVGTLGILMLWRLRPSTRNSHPSTAHPPSSPAAPLPAVPLSPPPPPATYIVHPNLPPAVLIVMQGQHAGLRFEIRSPQVTIGRNAANHFVLPDKNVSRFHARLWYDEYQHTYWVVNLAEGGLWVNRQAIYQQPCSLRGGEEIQLGLVILRFEVAPPVTAHPVH